MNYIVKFNEILFVVFLKLLNINGKLKNYHYNILIIYI